MEKQEKGPTKEQTTLQQVLQRLGHKNGVVAEAMLRLKKSGIEVTRSAMYQAIGSPNGKIELVDMVMKVAEEEAKKRQAAAERAEKLLDRV